jgi:hypothetical protein
MNVATSIAVGLAMNHSRRCVSYEVIAGVTHVERNAWGQRSPGDTYSLSSVSRSAVVSVGDTLDSRYMSSVIRTK